MCRIWFILPAISCLTAFGGVPIIRTAAGLTEALRDPLSAGRAFDITATTTYVSTNNFNENANIAGVDATGPALFRIESRQQVPDIPDRGSTARFRGCIVRNAYGRTFAVLTACGTLARGVAPEPADVTLADLQDPTNDFRLCRFSGTLLDAACQTTSKCWLMLSIGQGKDCVFATIPSFDVSELSRLESLVGSRISVTGICVPYDHSPRLQIGRMFKIASIDGITPLAEEDVPAPVPPSISDLRTMRPAEFATLGRHRAAGYVIAVWLDNHALLRTDGGDVVGLEFAGVKRLPRYGERIEAVGLPKTDLFGINLFNASWMALPGPALPRTDPLPLRMSQMLTTVSKERRRLYCCDYQGQAIRLRGIVRSIPDNTSDRRLYVECDSYLVPVDASATPQSLDSLSVGCVIDAAGTCVPDIDSPGGSAFIPRVRGFTLVVRTPDDIRIVSRPSWWTPGRLLAIIGMLLAVLFAIIVWNTALRRLAERRGRELADESLARATSDLKVYERTRLAVELHDSIAQNLTGVSLEIDTARRLADHAPGLMHEHLDTASRTLGSCRRELRNCLWDLRHQTLESDDMESAIRQTLVPHLSDARLLVRFKVPRDRISDNTAHAILRIVRELTVNAIRHGKASEVRVAGSIEGDRLMFSVRDNGCGFDPANVPGDEEGHFGLLGIRERVDAFEGTLQIDSAPGTGAKVTVYINIPHESAT